MLPESEIFKLLKDVNALIRDSHIVYTSGRHGKEYVNKDAIYPHTELTSRLSEEIARRFATYSIDAVVAPAVGGVILSQWIAYHLTKMTKKEVLGVYAEKENDSFVIKRGYDELIRGKRVLLVEDILTTGGSIKKVVEITKKIPAEVVGVAALCNRGSITKDMLGVSILDCLVSVNLESWEVNECALCQKNVPINTAVGKGREYLANKKS